MLLLLLKISDEKRLFAADDLARQTPLHGPTLRGLPDALVDADPKIQFVGPLVVERNEESIGGEDPCDLLVARLHQVVQMEGSAGRTCNAIDDRQTLSPAVSLLI